MGDTPSVRTTVIDVTLSDTTVDEPDVLEALCDIHVDATRAAIRDPATLLDWPEQLEAVTAL